MKPFKQLTLLIILSIIRCSLCYSQTGIDTTSFYAVMQTSGTFPQPIFIAEAHEIAGTYETELFIIETFLQKGNTNLILECGHAEAAILNEYLKTGEEEILYYTRARGAGYLEFMRSIRTLYLNNPALHIQGIDFERTACMHFLFQRWFSGIHNTKIDAVIQQLTAINENTNAKQVKKIFLDISSNYANYESTLDSLLHENASIFKQIIFNPVFLSDFTFSSKKRDFYILENIKQIPTQTLNSSVFIIGSNHFTNTKLFWHKYISGPDKITQGTLFMMAYENCGLLYGNKTFTSEKLLLNLLPVNADSNPVVRFTVAQSEQIPVLNDNGKFILVGLYNQDN